MRLGEPDYYNKHNFEMIFEQNAKYKSDDYYDVLQ